MTLYMKLKETYKDGLKAGLEQGIETGRAEGKSAYVLKFIKQGWTVDKIADFLEESPETIRALLPEGYEVRINK